MSWEDTGRIPGGYREDIGRISGGYWEDTFVFSRVYPGILVEYGKATGRILGGYWEDVFMCVWCVTR